MDIREDAEKIEVILIKEIHIYKLLLEYEEKKIAAILDNNMHDIDILCSFQNKEITKANELRLLREKFIDKISSESFSHLVDNANLLDIIKRVTPEKRQRLSSLRFELITVMAKVRNLNKLVPKLLEDGIDIYSKMKHVLADIRKIGYNSKGTEHSLNRRLGSLINKQV